MHERLPIVAGIPFGELHWSEEDYRDALRDKVRERPINQPLFIFGDILVGM